MASEESSCTDVELYGSGARGSYVGRMQTPSLLRLVPEHLAGPALQALLVTESAIARRYRDSSFDVLAAEF